MAWISFGLLMSMATDCSHPIASTPRRSAHSLHGERRMHGGNVRLSVLRCVKVESRLIGYSAGRELAQKYDKGAAQELSAESAQEARRGAARFDLRGGVASGWRRTSEILGRGN